MSHSSSTRANSFKGCWTCKARKIRCDERPNACRNCEKKGVTCGGYDVRLQWISDPLAAPAPSNQGRRTIQLDEGGGDRYRIEDIDGFLANIDNDTESAIESTRGPFTAFPVAIDGQQPCVDTLNTSNTSCFSVTDSLNWDLSKNHNSVPIGYSHNIQTPDSPDVQIPSVVQNAQDLIPIQRVEILDGVEQDPVEPGAPPDILLEQVGHDSFCDVISPDESLYSSLESSDSSSPSLSLQHISTSLFGDSQADLLINHYNTHIADLMQPIIHAQNVFRGIYLSTALEGSVICRSDPKTSKALVYSAIYHSLLSSSAFHLWNCGNAQTKYQRLGMKHRFQAIHFLQAAVEAAMPGEDYQIFMTAMLALLSIGTMSGDGNDFIAHINAATQLRHLRRRWRIVSRPTQKLNSISAFLAMLARTTSFQPPQSFGYIEPSSDDFLVRSSNCYEYIYGITPSIAGAIQETCSLAERLAYFQDRPAEPVPDQLLQACEALGDRLIAWKLSSENIMSIPRADSIMLTVFTRLANAWHRAALIYYYRRIQNFSSEDLVDDVRYVTEQIHASENAKGQLSQERIMAPITWPGFIASCEAVGEDREPLKRWWERVQRYNIGNINKQWDIVQQIWRRYDQMNEHGLDTPDWINSFKMLGFHVLAVQEIFISNLASVSQSLAKAAMTSGCTSTGLPGFATRSFELQGLPSEVQGKSVFLFPARKDDWIPAADAERLHQMLEEAGCKVTTT